MPVPVITHQVRVRYAETDQMGIVYYANYLIWFEIGRAEFCRARGFSYSEMEADDDAFLVVAESYCRYKAPAYYDDELLIRTHITELRKRSLRFGYEVVRLADGQIIRKVKLVTWSLIRRVASALSRRATHNDSFQRRS